MSPQTNALLTVYTNGESLEQSFKNTHIHMHYIKLPESSVGHRDGLAGGSSGGVSFTQLVMKHTSSN